MEVEAGGLRRAHNMVTIRIGSNRIVIYWIRFVSNRRYSEPLNPTKCKVSGYFIRLIYQ